MLGVVPHTDAHFGFRFALRQRFAHLEGHHATVLCLAVSQDLRRAAQQYQAIRQWAATPILERPLGAGQRALELRFSDLGKRLQDVTGGRVDRADGGGA
jgi:hypothetical protein